MTNDYNGDRRPLEVVGALVTIGAVGGSRGQLALRRLKWLASRAAALCLLVAPFTLLPRPYAAIWLGIARLVAFLSYALWCFAALARWLTPTKLIADAWSTLARVRRWYRAGAKPGHIIIVIYCCLVLAAGGAAFTP